jgi:hypothetical protein
MQPAVELPDHMAVLFLIFQGTSILFFIMAKLIYVPPTNLAALVSFSLLIIAIFTG